MLWSSFGLAFLAGLFSTLSPCILPLLPVILATAVSRHRFGPLALALGLSLSFSLIGLFVATIGFAIGLDEDVFHAVAAMLLVVVGLFLTVPPLEAGFAFAAGPIGNWVEQRFGGVAGRGLGGQFAVGLMFGALWCPCVGVTLGAVSLLAAQGENLGQVVTTMFLFGLGAAIALLFVGLISRAALMRWRGRILATGKGAKRALGAVFIVFGLLSITGLDRTLQAKLIGFCPQWLSICKCSPEPLHEPLAVLSQSMRHVTARAAAS